MAGLTDWMMVPWSSFVVAFLYYTALTALVLGGVSPVWTLVAGAYVGPLAAYALTLAWRLVMQAPRAVSGYRPALLSTR